MDIEAYKVAVKLSVTENISASLLAISRKFGDTNKQAELFQRKMEQIGKMTLAGGALTAAGLVITKGLDATIKAANDLVKAQNDFKTLNLSAQDNAVVNSQAQLLSHQTLGTTIAGNIRLIQDLHTAFGDLHHALAVSPEFAKYETTVKMAIGEHAADGAVNAMAKALEHRGGNVLTDPKAFNTELAMATQVQLATKNRVRPQDFLLASQTGGMAYSMLDKDYLYGKFAGLITMNQSGDRVGTMLMTAFSSLIGGHMDNKAKGFLANLGLSEEGVSKARMNLISNAMKGMSKEQKSIYMQSLGGEKLLSGGLRSTYADMFMHHPDQFVDVLVGKIRGKYGNGISDDQIAKIISSSFNKKTGDFLSFQFKNRAKLEKDATVFRHAMDYNKAYDLYLNSPDGATSALSSAWTNLKAVMGIQLLPTITNVTLGFARFIDKVSDFAEKHPWATKIAMYSATAAAGLSLLTGGILLLGATITAARLVGSVGMIGSMATMLGGPVAWAIAAVAGAGVLIYKNWDKIKPAAQQMGKEFGTIMTDIWSRMKQVGTHIASWSIWVSIEKGWNTFTENLTKGFNSVYNTIITLLNKIPGVNIDPTSTPEPKKNEPRVFRPVTNPTVLAYGSQGQSGGSVDMATGMKGMYQNRTTPSVPPAKTQTIQVHSTVNMDGKPVAQIITKHQTREATKPQAGVSAFDSTMGMVMPGHVSKLSTQ